MSMSVVSLVVATSNVGKLREIAALLATQALTIERPIDRLGYSPNVVEDGEHFEDNALIKARAIAALTGSYTLADDSGLEVDALGGLPGVRSARFAGEDAKDADNNRALVKALLNLGLTESKARFRCAIAVVTPSGHLYCQASGVCEGRVVVQPQGTNGFGYDPHFIVEELGNRTMAELTDSEKNQVSHRARALAAIQSNLRRLALGG